MTHKHDEELLHRILDHLLEEQRMTWRILEEMQRDHAILEKILHRLGPEPITGFTAIEETTMVPLAAGQTATFATTSLPAGTSPNPSALPVWTSSDPVNAPVVPVATDTTGLSANVTFPSTVAEGVSFSLTITYTNADGTTATQTDSFVTVAPPSPDITGFTPIVQTA